MTDGVKRMLVCGHRGARFEAPEDTIAGFRYAFGLRVDSIEFDVQLTRDGEVVVIHDTTVDRTTNGTGPVESFTLAELQALDAGADCPRWPERTFVPTLAQVLAELPETTLVSLEFKQVQADRRREIAAKTIDTIRQFGVSDRIEFAGYDEALEIAQELAPDIRRTLYWGNGDFEHYKRKAERLQVSMMDLPLHIMTPEMIDWARANGLKIGTGWINEEMSLAHIRRWDVDSIMTDVPSRIIPVLRKAEQ